MMQDIQQVQSALAFIPAGDRDTWLRMGMAVKSELGDAGFPIWDEWSQSDESYKERDAKSVWRSAKSGGGIGIGTLYHEAKQHGWKPSNSGQRPDPAEIARQHREREQRDEAAAKVLQADHEHASQLARNIVQNARKAPTANAYALRKGIAPAEASEALQTQQYECRRNGKPETFTVNKGDLLVPVYVNKKPVTIQVIRPDGTKLFLTGGNAKAGYLRIGQPSERIYVCEGYATGRSIHEATGACVVVAFNAGNIAPVMRWLAEAYPKAEYIIAADNDASNVCQRHKTEGATAAVSPLTERPDWCKCNPGLTAATNAARELYSLISYPNIECGKDWNDVRKLKGLDAVQAQIANAVTVAASSKTEQPPTVAYANGLTVRLLNGGDLEPEVIRWLWDGWLARGKLHVMAGAPGTGKTTIALALATTISTGGRFPDGTRCEAGNVLVWSGEDDPKDTLLPRLMAMGADRNRIYFVSDAYEAGKQIPFDPAKHFHALAEAALNIGGIRLMVVDPIVSAVAGDSHKAAEVRRSLQPVVDLAVKLDAAMVGISHFSKGTAGNDPLERVTGSNAFGALPRIVMATAKVRDGDEPDAATRRILVRTKSNIGLDGGGYNYSLEPQAVPKYPGMFAACVLWGEGIEGTAKQLLATAEADTDPDEQSEHKNAEDWLRDMLNETAGMPAGEVIKTAKANGYAERTIYRVKNRLRLVVKATGFGKERVSMWSLPITATPPITASITAITANPESGNNGSNGGSNDANGPIVV